MNLIPIFYFLKDGRVKIMWCEHVANKPYNSRWMGEADHDIIGVADCDLVKHIDVCDDLESAHDYVQNYYKNI